MPIKTERKLRKVGERSFAVSLPRAWVMYYGLRYGDVVEVIANEDITIRAKSGEKAVRDKG